MKIKVEKNRIKVGRVEFRICKIKIRWKWHKSEIEEKAVGSIKYNKNTLHITSAQSNFINERQICNCEVRIKFLSQITFVCSFSVQKKMK